VKFTSTGRVLPGAQFPRSNRHPMAKRIPGGSSRVFSDEGRGLSRRQLTRSPAGSRQIALFHTGCRDLRQYSISSQRLYEAHAGLFAPAGGLAGLDHGVASHGCGHASCSDLWQIMSSSRATDSRADARATASQMRGEMLVLEGSLTMGRRDATTRGQLATLRTPLMKLPLTRGRRHHGYWVKAHQAIRRDFRGFWT